jgi:hypothetical protein
MVRYILPLLLAALLAGCAIEHRANTEYTVSGQELGARGFRDIDAYDGKISFAGEDPVKRREAETLRDRYVERITLKNNGTLRYEKLFVLGFTSRDTPTDMIQSVLDGMFYKDRGIAFDRSKIKQTGQFTYFVQSSATDNCFVAYATFGSPGSNARQNSLGNESTYASMCYKLTSKNAAGLEREMVDLLSRARYDDGSGNRARYTPAAKVIPASAVPQASASPPQAAPVPASATAPTMAVSGPADFAKEPSVRLKQLEDAYRQNLMSEKEYQAKRKAILDAM